MIRDKFRLTAWVCAAAMVVVAFVATGVVGQRGPDSPGVPRAPVPGPVRLMETGPGGVFILAGNVLHKYSPDLKPLGTLKLPEPTKPADPDTPMRVVPVPARMILADRGLAILLGDVVFCVDASKLSLIARVKLPKLPVPEPPGPPAEQDIRPPLPFGPPPVDLRANGKLVYVIRADEIAAIDVLAGKLVAAAELPKPPLPGRID